MMEPIEKTGNTWTREIAVDGVFVRAPTNFHGRIAQDRSTSHPADVGRYHLYVSHACPWAHRTLVVRALKGLEAVISFDVVHPYLTDSGWSQPNRDRTRRAGCHRATTHCPRDLRSRYGYRKQQVGLNVQQKTSAFENDHSACTIYALK